MRSAFVVALFVLTACGQGTQDPAIPSADQATESRELSSKASVSAWTPLGICAELADAVGNQDKQNVSIKKVINCSLSFGVDAFNLWGYASAGTLVGDGTPTTVNLHGQEVAAMNIGFGGDTAQKLFDRLTTKYSSDKEVRRSGKGNIVCTNHPNGGQGVSCVLKSAVRFAFGE